jgi:hypothetical protein
MNSRILNSLNNVNKANINKAITQPQSGLTKTISGVNYTLIVAHRSYSYPSSYPGPSDLFFRNMFTTGYNTSFTKLSDIWGLTDGDNYVNSNLFTSNCTGYLLESYNYNGTQFPVWGTFDTSSHTWQSLQSIAFTFNGPPPGITISNSKLYSSVDTSVPVVVNQTPFLTTSYNSSGSTDWSTDTGDAIFIGISTTSFQSGDGYDTSFNNPTTGVTSIGMGISDGSGTNITMATYARRNSNYKHCTAVSNGTPITTGRSTSHGGADSTGFFLIWGKF